MLKFISEQLNTVLNIPYELNEWTADDIPDRYFVGEYTETPTGNEDGSFDNTLILTGTTRGAFSVLENDRKAIEKHFHPACGLCAETKDGAAAVFYNGAFPVPTGEADLKRIQINLTIKQWKGI